MTEEIFQLPGCAANHPGQGEVYLARPDAFARGRPLGESWPVLMALHGSGRQATSYRDVPFYRYQRDLALQSEQLFVCLSNGMDTWGLDDGLANIEALYAHLTALYPLRRRWTLWATSAGGALMHRLIARRGAWVAGALGTFPVYDLLDTFRSSPGCAKAWGAASFEELEARVAGRNPPELLSGLTSHPYLIFHGREDTLLAPERHSLRFRDEANGSGGRVEVVLTPGGHSTENFAVYDSDRIARSLEEWSRA